MLTNRFVSGLRLSDAEWAQATKGAEEFHALLS